MRRYSTLSSIQVVLVAILHKKYIEMAMAMLDSGPKLDWARDNQMFLRYKKWRSKIELIFRSALSTATPEEKTAYLKYWMGDEGLPLIEKWESTGKLDYSNAHVTPAKEGGRSRPLSSGFKLETYWSLLEEEFKPNGNKLISIIELWTCSKQGNKTLNEWLTYVYNLVEACNYGDSTDRIIRDVLIIGCESDRAKDKIIRRGETITLNETIEILQTEASANSTLRQFQEIQKKPTAAVYYQAYNSRSKKSKNPSNEQNSSSSTGSTESKRQCFRCGEPFSKKHMKECRAQNVTCNGCGIKGHLKKCCKKSGNFPKDSSNRQNQSSSTGPGRMNIATTLPQTEADFFDEKGVLKEYRPPVQQQHTGSMFVLKKIQDPSNAILFSENGVEIQHNTSTSVPDPDPAPIPSPDFPFQEFPLTEVVNQSQIDSSSISDTSDLRETSNSSRKATKSTDLPSKSGLNNRSHEEMRENRDLTVSDKHTQSSRDSSTISISDNSTTRKSIPGIIPRITPRNMTDTPSTPTIFPAETDVAEIPEEIQAQSNKSVMPTDIQALTVLQNLVSDDFQAKNTPSTQRKGEDTRHTHSDTHSTQRKRDDDTDEAFQLTQKIHNQLQQVQWDLQRLHSLHKYKN